MAENVTTRVGDLEIVAITDGAREFPRELFLSTSDAEIDALLAQSGKSAIQSNFNAFVIKGGQGVTMVDTGLRDGMGDATGHMPEGLAAAGVQPGDVTRLILTHLHIDHYLGALTPAGEAVFPNAEVILQAADRAFWSDAGNFAGKGEQMEGAHRGAMQFLNAYKDRLTLIDGDAAIAPGLTALPLPGHTPGHMGLWINSGDAQLVIATDIVHAQDLQLANPDIGVAFDIDPEMARAARKRTLDMLATDGIPFSGGHILAPGKFGTVARQGAGYAFVPST